MDLALLIYLSLTPSLRIETPSIHEHRDRFQD